MIADRCLISRRFPLDEPIHRRKGLAKKARTAVDAFSSGASRSGHHEGHEPTMNLQLLRGRDLRPPSRRDSVRPVAAPGIAQLERAPQQNGTKEIKEGHDRKKALRF